MIAGYELLAVNNVVEDIPPSSATYESCTDICELCSIRDPWVNELLLMKVQSWAWHEDALLL